MNDEQLTTYEELFHAAPDAMVVVNTSGVIVLANSRCESVLGYTPAELMGQPVECLIPEALRARHPEFRKRFADVREARGMGQGRMLSAQRKDGVVIAADISLAPLVGATNNLLFCVAVRDVSEHRRLEERLREVQRLEAIGTLAGGIAHDFNNILVAISNFGEFALSNLDESCQAATDVREVLKAADRATKLTEKLLAFSRKRTIRPKRVNLNQTVASLEAMLRRLLGESIDYSTTLAPNLWSTWVDPDAVEQVLVNLAINARDAMPARGKLTMETSNVTLDRHYGQGHGAEVPPGEYVMIAVTDNGAGMLPEVQARIFEPFFTTKPEGLGTGLGLATSYGIVKQAGGYIWVYSELGRGTTFKVYLPRVTGECDAAAGPKVPRVATGNETILVAEDDRSVRAAIARTLFQLGYQLLEAVDGQEALELCQQFEGKIDLLLTDVVMPRMNGRELATAAIEQRPNLKVLYLSGYTANVVVHHGVLKEGIELLPKPFTTEALANAVRTILDGGTLN